MSSGCECAMNEMTAHIDDHMWGNEPANLICRNRAQSV